MNLKEPKARGFVPEDFDPDLKETLRGVTYRAEHIELWRQLGGPTMAELEQRYPIMVFFKYDHLPPRLQKVSAPFALLARQMALVPRNAETSAGLRKLMEAKDCAVRAALAEPAAE